jgi:hypothetical protein
MQKKGKETNEEEELDKLVKRFSELLERNPRVRKRRSPSNRSDDSEGEEKDRFIKHGK